MYAQMYAQLQAGRGVFQPVGRLASVVQWFGSVPLPLAPGLPPHDLASNAWRSLCARKLACRQSRGRSRRMQTSLEAFSTVNLARWLRQHSGESPSRKERSPFDTATRGVSPEGDSAPENEPETLFRISNRKAPRTLRFEGQMVLPTGV